MLANFDPDWNIEDLTDTSDTFDMCQSSRAEALRDSLIRRYLAWLGYGMRFAFREHEAAQAARSDSALFLRRKSVWIGKRSRASDAPETTRRLSDHISFQPSGVPIRARQ